MPRHGECLKTNLGFPKDSEYFVRHILREANFFTPSQAGRAEQPGQTARRNPALPAANCSIISVSYWRRSHLQEHELKELVYQREGQECRKAQDDPINPRTA